jgi:hypothetical protein
MKKMNTFTLSKESMDELTALSVQYNQSKSQLIENLILNEMSPERAKILCDNLSKKLEEFKRSFEI